ncbi:MAG: methyltransferase [Actinomycetaceae bacterium]|nr:methyltransferase [Actinomycetaceae bacterium]
MPALGLDARLIDLLRSDLRAVSFALSEVNDLMGEEASAALLRNERVPALLAARAANSHLATAVRLFVLWDVVEEADVEAALPSIGVEGLSRLGLIEHIDIGVRARVQLQPHEAQIDGETYSWWIASDLGEGLTGTAPGRDHVLGIGGATRTLLELTPREQVDSVLDLGTGCGVQAMYAKTHARRVVATDLSKRAVDFARFNFALNELDIEVREGSLFEPVNKERFDLIVSNPPFVITPDSLRAGGVVEYRDGGRSGDDLVKEVVVGAASHLTAGGRAVMLGNWEIKTDWEEHPRAWAREAGLHAWFVQRERLDPAQYVEMWMRDNGARLAKTAVEYEETYRLWFEDFRERGVSGVGLGIIALANPSGSEPVVVCEEVVTPTSAQGSYMSQTMSEIFNHEITPEITDEEVFTRASDVRQERHFEPGEVDPQVIIATQGDGFGRRIQLNSQVSAVLGACDGELAVGQIITALHVLTEEDREEISRRVYSQLGLLVRAGMLRRIG